VSLASCKDLLNGANLRGARLQNSMLRFAALSTTDLEAADMSDADLMHARLGQANLTLVNLSNARLDHAHLAGAKLTNAKLRGARLRFTTLSSADLQAADMSDADLMHARLDQANLSSANCKNARLDYADFAGANLSNVNLCGACLQHAKNLTQPQLERSTGSASTILPLHLQGSVPWSSVISPTIGSYNPSGLPGVIARVDARFTGNPQHRWRSPALVSTVALIITAFIWQYAMLDGQWRSKRPTTDSSFPPEALTKTKSASDNRAPDGATMTVDQTSRAENRLAEELGEATNSAALPATVEPQATTYRLAKPLETTGLDQNAVKKANESLESTPLLLTPTPAAARPHAIVPNLSSNALASSDLARGDSPRQVAVSSGAEPRPNPPATNLIGVQDIETAAISETGATPPVPIRNPRR